MDNASSPLTFLPDGTPVSEMDDMFSVSLHETKAIGYGEGGLLLVTKENELIARKICCSKRVVCEYLAEQQCQWIHHHAA